ncbi:hypothetical protein [Bartonella tribocorum]|uniref:hypothetical protein n=1 Tax=Bartonella tribocorum TaxID=85701 RepID=UPI00043AE3EF|nr:hypothetical protein [Bartonella tribocorum]CDO49404.1 hypothetical protein BM1374166_01750 [Bartonella tribocorum]
MTLKNARREKMSEKRRGKLVQQNKDETFSVVFSQRHEDIMKRLLLLVIVHCLSDYFVLYVWGEPIGGGRRNGWQMMLSLKI